MVDLLSLNFLIPFFFALAVVYGALGVSGVFKNRAVNGIIAVVFAMIAATNTQAASFIFNVVPYAAILFVAIFLIALFLKPFRGMGGGKGELLIIILILLLIIFARAQVTGLLPNLGFFTSTNFLWIVGIIIVVFVLYKAYQMESK